jgi:CheY-like chemotaxis protein
MRGRTEELGSMSRMCRYYRSCGPVYGSRESLPETGEIHGFHPGLLQPPIRRSRSGPERSKAASYRLKVLIVEDSTIFRKVFKETLQDRFPTLQIEEASDAEEAMVNVETFLPDLIFMDIHLPGGNGLELTKRIKARHPEMIVIVLTAYDLMEYRELSLRTADYFFSKGSSKVENILALVKSIQLARSGSD